MELFPNPCQIQVVALQVKLSLNATITCAVYDIVWLLLFTVHIVNLRAS